MTQENMPDAEELKQERQPDEETCEVKGQAGDEPGTCEGAEKEKDQAEETCEGEKTEEQAEPSEEAEEKPGEDLAKKLSELEDSRLRLMAEYQNYRRRSEKEKSDIYAYANEEFAKQILEVTDNFERAMAAPTADDKYREGMELIFKQLLSVLEKNKVAEIEALGKPFDPRSHEAVMNDPSPDAESGTVTQVLQKGYTLNNKVIRTAKVAVAQ